MRWLSLVFVLACAGFSAAGPDVPKALENFEELKIAPKKTRETDPLVGLWYFESQGPTQKITGIVSVWKKRDVYIVQWSGASEDEEGGFGGMLMGGTGLREGNTFSVVWGDAKQHGLSVFKIEDKLLTGRWMTAGALVTPQEVWVWISPHKKGI